MTRILISEAALAAIARTMETAAASLAELRAEGGKDRWGSSPDGFAPIWLPKPVADALARLRRPGEDYSAVILRIAGDA